MWCFHFVAFYWNIEAYDIKHTTSTERRAFPNYGLGAQCTFENMQRTQPVTFNRNFSMQRVANVSIQNVSTLQNWMFTQT